VAPRRLVVGVAAAAALVLGAAIAWAPAGLAQAVTDCSAVSLEDGSQLMDAYAGAGAYPTVQRNKPNGAPTRVSVDVPQVGFTGPGSSATLPVGPCQHIYRYQFGKVQAPGAEPRSPFRYVEVDWNTEGLPRGPNNSFVSPHFDFHYYLRPRRWVDKKTRCTSTNGITCDPLRTSYPQMQCFLHMPKPGFVPASYGPDTGSSIPKMGLHLLDRTFDYTVGNVDHHPTLIYGTFNGEVLFAEASVTLETLQDAIAAPGQVVSFPFRQQRTVQGGVPWPTRFAIEYLPSSGGFRAGFERFRTR
jgi:hypothetical protein